MPDAGPQLRTIAGVELMKVGDWPAKSGDFKVTRTVLADAARAFEAGVLRKPPLKLGHWDRGSRARRRSGTSTTCD